MTCARQRTVFGAHGYAMPSRFLAEIPAELTDSPRAAPARAGLRDGAIARTRGAARSASA